MNRRNYGPFLMADKRPGRGPNTPQPAGPRPTLVNFFSDRLPRPASDVSGTVEVSRSVRAPWRFRAM